MTTHPRQMAGCRGEAGDLVGSRQCVVPRAEYITGIGSHPRAAWGRTRRTGGFLSWVDVPESAGFGAAIPVHSGATRL